MSFSPIKYRQHGGYDTEQASNEAAIHPHTWGPSLTIQSMAEDADINVLMERFGITGKMPINPNIPTYADFSEVTDFASALDAVARAQEAFMEYPAPLRAKFENNPQLFLEFCSRVENRDEMQKLGLLKQTQPDTTTPPATPPAPPVPKQ